MSLKIVTGKTEVAHVTSDDDAALNSGIFGTKSVVFAVGEELSAEIVSANTIKIKDGDFSFQGKIGRILPSTYETVSIANGMVGYKRNDIISIKYQKTENGIESMSLCVSSGTASEETPQDPSIPIGNIRNGDTTAHFPLYRVKISDLGIESLEKLFNITPTVTSSAPIGAGMDYFGNSEPYGWLFCNGQIVNKSDYPQLFNVIGYTYSQNSSGDTFALPDLRERTTVGIDSSSDTFNVLGKKVGEKKHADTIEEMPNHAHFTLTWDATQIGLGYTSYSSANKRCLTVDADATPGGTINPYTGNIGGGQPHNNIQPSFVCRKIIRAF